jgi:hypothetical protein
MEVGDVSAHKAEEPASFEKAASAINDFYTSRYRDDKGNVRYADVFNALGSLAGFGCQMAIREGFIKPGLMPENKAFVVVQTRSGQKFFFGDFLNTPLLAEGGGQISVWSLVGAAAQKAGARELPELTEILTHGAKVVGSAEFGVPRVPAQYRSQYLPIDVLKNDWSGMLKTLKDNKVDPRFWGWAFALAAQHLILNNNIIFDAGIAAKIMMETAIPMSKIDPASIGA